MQVVVIACSWFLIAATWCMICIVELEFLLATFGMPWFRLVMLQVAIASCLVALLKLQLLLFTLMMMVLHYYRLLLELMQVLQ